MNAENHVSILGVYWYFGFPENLYSYQYFQFNPGYGGHADNPAELSAIISVKDSDKLLQELQSAVIKHPYSYLRIIKSGDTLHISSGGYQLFDFDFRLIEYVDALLREFNAVKPSNPAFPDSQVHQYLGTKLQKHTYAPLRTLRVVGSETGKSNAETTSLRLVCNIPLENTSGFLNDVESVCKLSDIAVLYYYERSNQAISNLMIFFTNGRQGFNSEPVLTALIEVEKRVIEAMTKHGAKSGFSSEVEYPETSKPAVILSKDIEYILK